MKILLLKSFLFKIAKILIPIFIFFFLAEGILHLAGFPYYVRTYPNQIPDNFYKFEGTWYSPDGGEIGWVIDRKNKNVNKQGFLGNIDFDKIDYNNGKKRIMFLGDSFLYDDKNLEHTIPSLICSELGNNYECYNVSAPGWGIDQMYLAFLKYHPLIKPNFVILCFIDDDVNRVLEAYRKWEDLNKPSFLMDKGRLVLRTPENSKKPFGLVMFEKSKLLSLILHETLLFTDAKNIIEAIFNEINSFSNSGNYKFMVVRIPLGENKFNEFPNLFHQIHDYEKFFSQRDIIYLHPDSEMKARPRWQKYYFIADGHLSLEGKRFIGRSIVDQFFKSQ